MDRQSMAREVVKFLDSVEGRRLIIQVHDVPDPDAIASAEAFRLIAAEHGVHALIVANGFPQRRENRALIKECHIHFKPLQSILIRKPERHAWAYIDCLPGGGNVTLHDQAPGDRFIAIDHHVWATRKRFGNRGLYLTDIAAGATATIMTRLLFDLGVAFPPRLAAALSYAIITDTMDFSRGNAESDLESFAALFPHTNQKIISRLRNAPRPRQYFRTVHQSLDNAYAYRHVAWVDVGEVSGGEIVAEMADFILSCERITWALALGRAGSRMFMSLRSTNPKARCGRLIGRILEKRTGAVGGHDQFAGGFVEIASRKEAPAVAAALIERFLRLTFRIPKSAPAPEGTPLAGE